MKPTYSVGQLAQWMNEHATDHDTDDDFEMYYLNEIPPSLYKPASASLLSSLVPTSFRQTCGKSPCDYCRYPDALVT